ncbi:PAS domain S-box [Burkholderiales bacterium GJ-E10]|nr:PAS domain S-box [Burkholderiales bacterium GJ-E10]
MTEDPTPNTPQPATDKPAARKQAATAIEQDILSVEQHIETWFHDLLASLPHLRETATYNHLRTAIDELKHRLS